MAHPAVPPAAEASAGRRPRPARVEAAGLKIAPPFRVAALLGFAALLWLAPGIARAEPSANAFPPVSMTNVSPAFRPGPYSSLTVDLSNPYRLALGTADGHVLWSDNGARTSHESQALSPRLYDPMIIRGGAKASLSMRGEDDAKMPEARSLVLFLDHLAAGRPPARYQFWMAVSDPSTEITELALPPGRGRMAAAAPSGILLSGEGRGAWFRPLGAPGNMPKEGDLQGVSVAIDPLDPNHLLAGTDRGIFVSRDGGRNFMPHPDPKSAGDYVLRFLFDPGNPSLVFAVTPDNILLSEDSGESFEPAFPASGIIDLNVTPEAALISASDGLHVASSAGVEHYLKGKEIIGAAPWKGGSYLAASRDTLYIVSAGGDSKTLLRTIDSDPFLRLTGTSEMAWALTSHTLLRLGEPTITAPSPDYRAPRMLVSLEGLEKRIHDHYGLGGPTSTRLHDRWYAELIPAVDLTVANGLCGYIPRPGSYRDACAEAQHTQRRFRALDGAFPVRYRQLGEGIRAQAELTVLLSWDLSQFVFGNSNAVHPNLVIESNLRNNLEAVIREIRWRYRETAALVGILQEAPADPAVELLWRLRLEEYASYLEFMSGAPVVANYELESL